MRDYTIIRWHVPCPLTLSIDTVRLLTALLDVVSSTDIFITSPPHAAATQYTETHIITTTRMQGEQRMHLNGSIAFSHGSMYAM